jgi:hypothetical protein
VTDDEVVGGPSVSLRICSVQEHIEGYAIVKYVKAR